MKKSYKFFLKSILPIFSLLSLQSYAIETAYVFCFSNLDSKWEWLKNSSDQYVQKNGEWKDKSIGRYFFQYFLLEQGSMQEIESLKAQCLEKYGQNYSIVQPSKGDIDYTWKPFGLSQNYFVNGKIDVRYLKEKIVNPYQRSCGIGMTYSPTQPEYLNNSDIIAIINNKTC